MSRILEISENKVKSTGKEEEHFLKKAKVELDSLPEFVSASTEHCLMVSSNTLMRSNQSVYYLSRLMPAETLEKLLKFK